MKINTGIIILILCISLSSSAQSFQGGIFAGINASQIDNDTYGGFNKLGLNAGAFVSREITPNFYWQMELKYSSRGMYHHPTINQNFIALSNLKYLELPLSIHYFYNEKIQVELGFAPDVLLSEYYEDEHGSLDPAYAPDLRRFGVNVFGGIYYYFIENMAVGIRYTYSAIPFYPFDFWTARYRDKGYFHDVLCLSVKYYFVR